jgi:hypothetical protein
MTTIDTPPRLDGCNVLPPLVSGEHKQLGESEQHKPKEKSRHGKTADRFNVLNNFVDFTMGELPRGCVAVWLVLYRDTKDGTARTSQADIARRAGMSPRGVRDAIRRLESLGLLKTVYQGGLNRGPSRYRVSPLTREDSLRKRASG